jgi:hypothetical protein
MQCITVRVCVVLCLLVASAACVQEKGTTESGVPDVQVIQVPIGGSGATGAGVSGPTQ